MGELAFGAPQIIYVVLSMLGLGFVLAKDGEASRPYSFYRSLFSFTIIIPLLWWGGFFTT